MAIRSRRGSTSRSAPPRMFVHTDTALGPRTGGGAVGPLDRDPLPCETSEPDVFAIADVRSGS